MCVFISRLSILFHWFVCLGVLANTVLFWLLQLCRIVWNWDVSYLWLWGFLFVWFFIFLSGLLWLFRVFVVSYIFWGVSFYFVKKSAIWILKGIALNLYSALGNINSLIILILQISEHIISFYYFVSLISFSNALWFSMYRSFTFLNTPRYFILLLRLWMVVLFLSPSHGLLLAYRNATHFCILILYPATFLYLFIISNSFHGVRVFCI